MIFFPFLSKKGRLPRSQTSPSRCKFTLVERQEDETCEPAASSFSLAFDFHENVKNRAPEEKAGLALFNLLVNSLKLDKLSVQEDEMFLSQRQT